MLHITDGQSVAGTLRESAIPGAVSIYGDLMFEGPAPAGLEAEAWREIRARFIADAGYLEDGLPDKLAAARQYLKGFEETLAACSRHEEVVLWLDYRLSDQLILIKLLDWFSRQDSGEVKLSLICPWRYPGLDPFVGLGQLQAEQLAALVETRLPVTETQFRLARAAWNAFTSPEPTGIERFIATDTSALPFIAGALRRHLEQLPAVDSGLSRTETQVLSVLRDQGSVSGPQLFVAVQRMEEQVFMGDVSFYRIVADLSRVQHPLVQISDTPHRALGEVTITATGQEILESRKDQLALNGIDRWLGGVHLTSSETAWRWDRVAQRIVRRQSP